MPRFRSAPLVSALGVCEATCSLSASVTQACSLAGERFFQSTPASSSSSQQSIATTSASSQTLTPAQGLFPRRHMTKQELRASMTLPELNPDGPYKHLLANCSDGTAGLYNDIPIASMVDAKRMQLARLLRRHNYSLTNLKGQTILAKVLRVDEDTVYIDPGFYGISEIPRRDLGVGDIHVMEGQEQPERSSVSDLRVGDVLRVRVTEIFSPYGDMQLDAVQEEDRLKQRRVWQELQQMQALNKPVYGRVLNACTGGYAVGIAGLVALLPHSRCTAETVSMIGNLELFYIDYMDDRTSRVFISDARYARGLKQRQTGRYREQETPSPA